MPISSIQARITFAGTEVEVPDGESTKIVDLSLEGQYMISVEFVDPIQPAVVLMAQNFTFPSSVTKADAYQRIHDYGQRLLWSRMIAESMSVGEIINIKKPDAKPRDV